MQRIKKLVKLIKGLSMVAFDKLNPRYSSVLKAIFINTGGFNIDHNAI